MNFSEYTEKAKRTLSSKFEVNQSMKHNVILHGVIGISTESGELLDALEKTVFYGKELDTVNIREEIGDLMWYVAILCDAIGVKMEDILDKNIEKLSSRYPEKFTTEAALNRDLEKERKILEDDNKN